MRYAVCGVWRFTIYSLQSTFCVLHLASFILHLFNYYFTFAPLCPLAFTPLRRYAIYKQRLLKNLRISSDSNSGFSIEGKCPPEGKSLHC